MKYKQVYTKEGSSWTDWIMPIRKGYKVQCCKCGKIHKVDFRIVKQGKRNFIQFRVK